MGRELWVFVYPTLYPRGKSPHTLVVHTGPSGNYVVSTTCKGVMLDNSPDFLTLETSVTQWLTETEERKKRYVFPMCGRNRPSKNMDGLYFHDGKKCHDVVHGRGCTDLDPMNLDDMCSLCFSGEKAPGYMVKCGKCYQCFPADQASVLEETYDNGCDTCEPRKWSVVCLNCTDECSVTDRSRRVSLMV